MYLRAKSSRYSRYSRYSKHNRAISTLNPSDPFDSFDPLDFYDINNVRLSEERCSYNRRIRGVVFDLAGTIVDFGVMAPVRAMRKTFRHFGVTVSEGDVRFYTGLEKKEHIRKLGFSSRVRESWRDIYKRDITEEDIESLYRKFVPNQITEIKNYPCLVPNSLEVIEFIRGLHDVKLGSTSGYNRAMVDVVIDNMSKRGLNLDITVASDEILLPRPYAEGCRINMKAMGLRNPTEMVKVGDTDVDVEEGRNAGMWTVAVLQSSNYVGLTPEMIKELEMNNPDKLGRIYKKAENRLIIAEPDYLASDITRLPYIISDINNRMINKNNPRYYPNPIRRDKNVRIYKKNMIYKMSYDDYQMLNAV